MVTLVGGLLPAFCFLRNKLILVSNVDMLCELFFKDGLSRVDICFGHMKNISLMLLELKERHL